MSTNLPAKARRVNPIKIMRRGDVSRLQGHAAPMGQPLVYRPNYWAIAMVGIVLVYAIWMTVSAVNARIENARLEGKQEVQEQVIQHLQEKDKQEARDDGARIDVPAPLVNFLILAVISAVVGAFFAPAGVAVFMIGALLMADHYGFLSLVAA